MKKKEKKNREGDAVQNAAEKEAFTLLKKNKEQLEKRLNGTYPGYGCI